MIIGGIFGRVNLLCLNVLAFSVPAYLIIFTQHGATWHATSTLLSLLSLPSLGLATTIHLTATGLRTNHYT